MSQDAINPNHPTVKKLDGNWHKVAAFIMVELGVKRVLIRNETLDNTEPMAIAARPTQAGLEFHIIPLKDAEALAKKEGNG